MIALDITLNFQEGNGSSFSPQSHAGMAARCDTAWELIGLYLDGKLQYIEELEQKRLYKKLGGFAHYSSMATPNIKI